MKIRELTDVITTSAQDDRVSLSEIARHHGGAFTILDNFPFPQARELVLKPVDIKYDTSKDTLTITGASTWITDLGLTLTVRFFEKENEVVCLVTVELPKDHQLGIPGLKWFCLDEVSLVLESLPPGGVFASLTRGFRGSLKCKLKIEGVAPIPISATYPAYAGMELSADLDGLEFPSLFDLARIVGGKDAFQLPEQVEKLGKIKLHRIALTVGPSASGANTLSLVRFEFGTAEPWDLVPGAFTIDEIRVAVNVFEPLVSEARKFGGSISGSLTLGSVPVTLEAAKYFPGDPWTFSASIPSIDLGDLAKKALAMFSLPAQLPAVRFKDTLFTVTPEKGAFSFKTESASDSRWEIPLGGLDPLVVTGLRLEASRTDGRLGGKIAGSAELFGSVVTLEADLTDRLSIRGTVSSLNLGKIASELLKGLSLPADMPDFVFKDVTFSVTPATGEFSLAASSGNQWPLGFAAVKISDFAFSVTRKREKPGDSAYATTGFIGGKLDVCGNVLDVRYNFPGGFVLKAEIPSVKLSPLLNDVCGPDGLLGLPLPPVVRDLELTKIVIEAAPHDGTFSVSAASRFGKLELIVTKNEAGGLAFILGLAPPDDFKLSSIDPGLKPLDGLNFSGTALVVSSAKRDSLPLHIISKGAVSVIRGVNLFLDLDFTGAALDDLMKIKKIAVTAAIGLNPADTVLEAGLAGSFKVADNVSLGDMKLFLKPAPSVFALGVSGKLSAVLNQNPLVFKGSLNIVLAARTADFNVTMEGEWKEPFGVKNLSVKDLAIEVGLSFPPPPLPPAPVIGLAGKITIGSFTSELAVRIDPANPGQCMFFVKFNRLYVNEIMQSFCDKAVYDAIPEPFKKTVLATGFEDVEVYVVPEEAQIGDVKYKKGFKFQGRLIIGDFHAAVFFLIDYSKGIAVKGTMDTVDIAGVFKLSGSGDQPKPLIDIDLTLGGTPHAAIAGSIELLGLKRECRISIDQNGFSFFFQDKIFNLFQASVTATGKNFKEGGDFGLVVRMQNDFFSFLREKAQAAIQAVVDDGNAWISGLQNNVRQARAEARKLEDDVTSTRDSVRRERDQAAEALGQAVAGAQGEVRRLEDKITEKRKDARARFDAAAADLRQKENDVAQAQKIVDGYQGDINSAKNRIAELNRAIADKNRWYDNSQWYEKTYRWAELSACVVAWGAEMTLLYGKIGAIEGLKLGVVGILELAKQGLKLLEDLMRNLPSDLDPETDVLYLELGTAKGKLAAAELSLAALRESFKNIPIDYDPRVLALVGLKEVADRSLAGFITVLDGAKAALGAVGRVGEFIVTAGLGGLFDVKEAEFRGQLNVVKGGSVDLHAKLVFMNNEVELNFGFNFNDIPASVKSLAAQLINTI